MAEKKHKHISSKDLADEEAQKLGRLLENAKAKITELSYTQLLQGSDLSGKSYIDLQNSRLSAFSNTVDKIFKVEKKKIMSAMSQSVDTLGISKTPTIKEIEKDLNVLRTQTITNHRMTIAGISAIGKKLESPSQLYPIIVNAIKNQQNKGVVIYADDSKRNWTSYIEMKFRTDTQIEIGRELIETGKEIGNIFYVCTKYGDCAKDHVDLQEMGIFYDQAWRDYAPADRVEEIQAYITNNKIMSIQEAQAAPYWFTTRPNCRHYFDYIPLDDVLGFKDKKEMNAYREENGYTRNGKYEPEKYDALQQQRSNERNIRYFKEKLEIADKELKAAPDDLDPMELQKLKNAVIREKGHVMKYQAQQRELLKKNPHLYRQYDRERPGYVKTNMGTTQPKQYKPTKNKDLK